MTKKKRRDKNKKRKRESTHIPNPLLDAQSKFLCSVPKSERDGFFSPSLPAERRAELWMEQADLGETLVNDYAWATPDERALKILKHFSPIVEIGCGSNAYWCRCMKQAGVDVVGFDAELEQGGKISESSKHRSGFGDCRFPVSKGGADVLSLDERSNANRTLFLCYPDENDQSEGPLSLGAACLDHYKGDYVIHVGELYADTLSMDQAPWGRSSSREFQEQLAQDYHCVLKAGLTNWLHVKDTISVWKRSEVCSIVFAAEDEDDEDEEVTYRHIPIEDRLPVDIAAPRLVHLLENNERKDSKMLKSSSADKGTSSTKTDTVTSDMYSCPW